MFPKPRESEEKKRKHISEISFMFVSSFCNKAVGEMFTPRPPRVLPNQSLIQQVVTRFSGNIYIFIFIFVF